MVFKIQILMYKYMNNIDDIDFFQEHVQIHLYWLIIWFNCLVLFLSLLIWPLFMSFLLLQFLHTTAYQMFPIPLCHFSLVLHLWLTIVSKVVYARHKLERFSPLVCWLFVFFCPHCVGSCSNLPKRSTMERKLNM